MQIFIDETGQFTFPSGWSAVCSIALPHKEVGPARRELTSLSKYWPHASNGELKGGQLEKQHLRPLVDLLFRHDTLMSVFAINVAAENADAVKYHQTKQCEGLTANLTDEHKDSLVAGVWDLRRTLEGMPSQLYIQSVLMTRLVDEVIEHVSMYFSQRRPRELADFKWTIDAKDPLKITTQENWWKTAVAPWIESRSRREPLNLISSPECNYQHFEKAYFHKHNLWNVDGSRTEIYGYDIGKMLCGNMHFVDSRSDILIQAVDILASFLRRILSGQSNDFEIAEALGRLQICKRHSQTLQSINIVTLSNQMKCSDPLLAHMIEAMGKAGRSMLRKSPKPRQVSR